ncbi:adenomatous polyposis coli protein 2-like [Hyaena hyaena]|uniref:adenomatous polyposis coli protein 2-like n=1 Tax=Hyaena hyaena TaxID=95912 RepID=UPI0019205719|nr:adenomatous polyposis coli protein 2-like [Hyaena hyaena]
MKEGHVHGPGMEVESGAEQSGSSKRFVCGGDGGPGLIWSKVEVVFWLLSMLATRDQEDTARTLLAMSSSPESCVAMRRSGCLPLLLQILHGTEAGAGGRSGAPGAPGAKDARMRANAALHNIVFSQPDQGLARKEMRVLHVLEQIRAYCETCWDWLRAGGGAEAAALEFMFEKPVTVPLETSG